MKLGTMTKVYTRSTITETLDALKTDGFSVLHFNHPLPSSQIGLEALQSELTTRGQALASLSGTYNMIHPDLAQRNAGYDKLRAAIFAADALKVKGVALSTGTRDAQNMWRFHPENASKEAWSDLTQALERALTLAQEQNVVLLIEPEASNVVSSAQKCRQILDEMQSPFLKVIMDGANLFQPGQSEQMDEVLHRSFDLLQGDIFLAHAKDIADWDALSFTGAGNGLLNFPLYLSLLKNSGYRGPLLLHGQNERETPACRDFLLRLLEG